MADDAGSRTVQAEQTEVDHGSAGPAVTVQQAQSARPVQYHGHTHGPDQRHGPQSVETKLAKEDGRATERICIEQGRHTKRK